MKENLLVAYKRNPSFFSLGRLQSIAKMLLTGLAQLHKMTVIHCDLKPENILIKSYQPFEVKIVDLGNSSFIHDEMGNYIQSRSYRAPEVIFGLPATPKIDIWSLGCILAELWTTNILFSGLHIQGMLARMQSILGPWPDWML
jgi:dual specificity tyrosine-phosphorylation-regulated kinase 2/3/4